VGDLAGLFWPAAASEHASEVDLMLLGLSALCTLLTLPVFVLLVWFAAKYRRGSAADRSGRPRGSWRLEFAWALVPLALVLVFYVWAAKAYFVLDHPPADALQIAVVAQQWMWKFQHPGGQREINELHVPAGRPIQLNMSSQDVMHSLYFPALRIKRDVLPGRTTVQWFEADRPGVHHLLCTEFCGTAHSEMRGRIVVLTPDAYADWLARQDVDLTLAERGARLFRSYGCSGCHENSDVVRAPALYGVYGQPVPLGSGEVVVADEQYIRDSILLPMKQVAAGYRPVMPSFSGRIPEEDLVELVAYIKSLASSEDYGP
jgi:cytochrome c oxidase subunit 2